MTIAGCRMTISKVLPLKWSLGDRQLSCAVSSERRSERQRPEVIHHRAIDRPGVVEPQDEEAHHVSAERNAPRLHRHPDLVPVTEAQLGKVQIEISRVPL